MRRSYFRLLEGVLFSLPLLFASCGNGDNALEEIINGGGSGGSTPTVEEIIKYGFKVTDLTGVDRTEAVTSLKMSNEDGTLVAEAEVSGGKITITNTKLTEAGITAAADFWFEAEIGGQPYIAKVNIDPTTLSPESDKTLAMATLGDVILSDGKFAARTSTGTNVAMIAYLGSSTGVAGYTHGLALALTDKGTMINWTDATGTGVSGAAAHTPAAPTPMTSSWMLPSKDQWDKMIDACKNVLGTQNNYKDLRDSFSDITGASNLSSAFYWSSTEYEDDLGDAWMLGFSSGIWKHFSKGEDNYVRACLAF